MKTRVEAAQNWPGFSEVISEVKGNGSNVSLQIRRTLLNCLKEQYSFLGLSPPRDFDRLENPNSRTITTGHQLQLFGGPAFLHYKVITAIRKAQETNIRDKFQLIEAKRYVNQEVKSAFAQYNSSLIKVNSSKKQFEANQIALEGVKEEFELGTRTNLDVLDAEQEFLDSQVSMISSENNSKLSMFYLLLSIGSLSPEELSLPISKYDPNENYNKVKNIKLGWKRFKDIKNLD